MPDEVTLSGDSPAEAAAAEPSAPLSSDAIEIPSIKDYQGLRTEFEKAEAETEEPETEEGAAETEASEEEGESETTHAAPAGGDIREAVNRLLVLEEKRLQASIPPDQRTAPPTKEERDAANVRFIEAMNEDPLGTLSRFFEQGFKMGIQDTVGPLYQDRTKMTEATILATMDDRFGGDVTRLYPKMRAIMDSPQNQRMRAERPGDLFELAYYRAKFAETPAALAKAHAAGVKQGRRGGEPQHVEKGNRSAARDQGAATITRGQRLVAERLGVSTADLQKTAQARAARQDGMMELSVEEG